MAKIMVSLPEDLVREIDDVARRRSMSRSALIAAAALRDATRRGDVESRVIDLPPAR